MAVRTRPDVRRLRDLMTPFHRCKYLAWRALKSPRPIVVQLRSRDFLILRKPVPDLAVAYEVFMAEFYRLPRTSPRTVTRVVDVGANVGYSVVYFRRQFPAAEIIAFEPDASRAAVVREHARLNGFEHDLTLHVAAAAAKEGSVFLTQEEESSTVKMDPGPDRLQVRAVDFFQKVGDGAVDLLKMDIEGGEYELLQDPRFAELKIQALVLEWHRRTKDPQGPEWCVRRLRELGFQTVTQAFSAVENGIIWALRD